MKELIKGTFSLTISSLFFVISGYLTSIWLGRYFGPSKYGIYGVIITLMTTINLTQTTGLPLAVSKYIAEDEKKSDQVLRSGLILQVASTFSIALVFLFLSKPIAVILHDASLVSYIQAISAVFPLY